MKFGQIVPEKICLACDVCCRFIDKDSPLRPFFFPKEITAGIRPRLDKSGRISLKKHPDIHTCPFFNLKNNKCAIYAKRPLDCRLYPFTVMFGVNKEKIILGLDTKCPFAADSKNQAALKKYSSWLVSALETEKAAGLIASNPLFIGGFQDDVVKIACLDRIAKILIHDPAKNGFRPLALKDRRALGHFREPFVNLYIWKDLNPVWWKKEGGKIKLLLETESGYIDYSSIKKFPDYIYLRKDLAELKGKRYRHKRASCNHFAKNYKFRYLPYRENMKNECLRLFSRWAAERKKKFNDPYYRCLLKDSSSAHRTAMENHKALGLVGRVIKIKGGIRGYAFGFKLKKDTFCVLLEVTDLKFNGISEFIFREFCKEMSGYRYINTMDDSGLENLRASKLSYHPINHPQQM
ncbi:MAG: phosphatidylglycerol lysyltransferase domain-containing protein [Candidatus Omnitrophota bacterium]